MNLEMIIQALTIVKWPHFRIWMVGFHTADALKDDRGEGGLPISSSTTTTTHALVDIDSPSIQNKISSIDFSQRRSNGGSVPCIVKFSTTQRFPWDPPPEQKSQVACNPLCPPAPGNRILGAVSGERSDGALQPATHMLAWK